MRKTARIIILALLCAASYSACQRASEENKEGQRQVTLDSLSQSYQGIHDSLDVSWQALIAEEDQKLANMRRLLQEISYFPVYNKARLIELQEKLKEVYEMRFQPESMTSEQIDRYDSAVTALKRDIFLFAEEHPDVEKYPLVTELIDSIQGADQKVLFLRVRYDNYAMDYNNFLEGIRQVEGSEEYLRKIDTTDLFSRRSLFQLEEEAN